MFTSILAFGVAALAPLAGQSPIVIDGRFSDWDRVEIAYTDSTGDGGNIDFGRIWLASDDRFFFVRFQTEAEILLNDNNDISIYLDTDSNPNTGFQIAGIGAELQWRPGLRSGVFRPTSGVSSNVIQDDISFRGAPTVSAAEFEIAFGLDAMPDGLNLLFTGGQVGVVLVDGPRDQVPEIGDSLEHTLLGDDALTGDVIPINRQGEDDLRLVTFNVLNDAPWRSEAIGFRRLPVPDGCDMGVNCLNFAPLLLT